MSTAAKQRIFRRTGILLLVFLCVSVYLRNVDDYFVGDDFDLIQSFHGKGPGYFVALLVDDESGDIWDYLCHAESSECPDPENHGFLRPFKMWIFGIDHLLWGTNPIGYHVTALLFFGLTVLGVFLIMERLVPDRPAFAWLGGWFAAIHPVFAEVVPSITYREEVIASATALAAVWYFLRYRQGAGSPIGFYVAYGLALLTKESAIATLGIVLVYDGLHALADRETPADWLRRARVYLPVAAILVVYFALRLVAFHSLVGGHGETDHLALDRFLSFHRAFATYVFAKPFFSGHAFPWLKLVFLAGLVSTMVFMIQRRERLGPKYWINLLFLSVGWYVATTSIAHGVYFSPRHVVMPVLGMILALAYLAYGVSRCLQLRRDEWLVLGAVVLANTAWLPPTIAMSSAYDDASRTVERIRREIEVQTAGLPDGSRVLLIDVPEFRPVAPPYFGLGLRSALSPPFTPSDVEGRLVIETVEPARGGPTAEFDLVLRFTGSARD